MEAPKTVRIFVDDGYPEACDYDSSYVVLALADVVRGAGAAGTPPAGPVSAAAPTMAP